MAKEDIKNMKKLIFILIFFLPMVSYGATSYTASTCSPTDINAALLSCKNDSKCNTIYLPACSGGSNGSTWSSNSCVGIYDTKEYHIIGAGKDATVIKYANGNSPPESCSASPLSGHPTKGGFMMEIHGSGFKELSNLTLSGSDSSGAGTLYLHMCDGATDARVHHAGFKKGSSDHVYICSNLASTLLLDHIYVGDKVGAYAYGIRIHGNNNENTWLEPITTLGQNIGVFVEDSEFNGTYHPVAGHGSAQYTIRYNTFSNFSSALEGHGPSYQFGCIGSCSDAGTDAHCFQGVYRVEVYNNTFNAASYSTYSRSGHWVITDNTFINQTSNVHSIELETQSVGGICNSANGCPRITTGWAGTGSCQKAGQGCWDSIHAVYIWNNTYINCAFGCSELSPENCLNISDKGTGCVRQNYEYFLRAPQVGDPEVTSYSKYTYPHPLQGGVPDPRPSAPKDFLVGPTK